MLFIRRLSSARTMLLFIALTSLVSQPLPAAAVFVQQKESPGFDKEPVEKVFKSLGTRYKVRFFYAGSVTAKNTLITMPAAGRSR